MAISSGRGQSKDIGFFDDSALDSGSLSATADPALENPSDPLAWALVASDARSVMELAYRYCRYEPGIDLVLTGTGNVQHLEENVASMLRPPLPAEVRRRLGRMFGRVRSATGW